MAHAPYLREKARELRISKQLTIDELAERLALSRSTVYYWVRDLPIFESGAGTFQHRGQRLGTRAMQQRYKARRDEAYADGRRHFAELADDPTFRDFVCLYLAEGYKRDRNRVAVGNSDPAIVLLSSKWVRRYARNPVRYSLQYHADQDVRALRGFWGQALGIGEDRVTLQRKSNSNQMTGRIWRCRYGVLTVTADDTLFRARLEAWMDCLKASWG
jgi:AcrR family transcriptional regulator